MRVYALLIKFNDFLKIMCIILANVLLKMHKKGLFDNY